MNKIKILPENLANQIAAGEVVERPASVIKELVENSIDAGAKRVKIEIELGGRRLMQVSDDGIGMLKDDAILSFERHATSKLSELKDLGNIKTLGFRGEALASIASVAKVELITKTFDGEAATRVSIEGGKLIDVKEAARPTGTTIKVRDLFFNTPARRKFMRSQATENYHIASTVQHYSLANPKIAFTLTNNGRETIRVAPAKDLRERAYQLFGAEMIESLLPVNGGREFIANISGFISAPRERRTTRDSQYFFINGRFVKDKIIAGGLLEGYRSVLPHGVYPVAFLFLDIPLEEIDVNVHPAKTEVRFRRAQAVKDVIAETIRKTLQTAGIVRGGQLTKRQIEFKAASQPSTSESLKTHSNISSDKHKKNAAIIQPQREQPKIDFEIPATSHDFESLASERIQTIDNKDTYKDVSRSENEAHPSTTNQEISSTNYAVLPPVDSAESIPNSIEVSDISASKIQPIAQLHKSFIIAIDDKGLLLIDQHVAHERILFDKFRQKETERQIESQNLLVPETIDLSPSQIIALEEIEEEIEACGFGIMKLSGRTIAIKSVPTDLPPGEIRNLFIEILGTVEKEKRGKAKLTFRDNIAASMACKAAVKINMELTQEKMLWMIDNLLTTSSPTTCPHGRPIILRLTMKDIERKFHRS